jgi:hypothetical protein
MYEGFVKRRDGGLLSLLSHKKATEKKKKGD